MATYIVLMSLTDQGIKSIKQAPARVEATAKALEAAGGRLRDFYSVMGQFDYVVIAECPGDEVAMTQLLALGMAGNVRTVTLKAFDRKEFEEILKRLP